MRMRTPEPTIGVAGVLLCIGLIMATLPADARSTLNRSINMAAQQSLLTERMTNGTMLAVLGIDAERNIREVRSSRDLFNRTLRGLRSGDPELGLVPALHPEIIAEIERIEAFWPRYDRTLQGILTSLMASSEISDMQIRQLSDIHTLMIEAVGRTVGAFEHFSNGGNTYSIVTTTLSKSGQLRAHTQLVLGELLAVAYRSDDVQSRRMLGQATRDFDRALLGLIHGDIEMRLLPAPTLEIDAELTKVQRLWTEIRPILERISTGAEVDAALLATVSYATNRMIEPLNTAILMYESL